MARSIDKEVLSGFIEEAQGYLPAISSGIETFANDATQMECLAEAHRYAHSIKGTSSMLGFFGLSYIAHNLEEILEDIASEEMAMDDAISSLLVEAVGQMGAYLEHGLQDTGSEGPILAEANRIFRRIHGLPEHGDEEALERILTDLSHQHQTMLDEGKRQTIPPADDAPPQEDVPPELLEIFSIEADDHLRNISSQLSSLEKEPAEGEHLQSLRRSVHTLKGAAGAVGLHLVAQLTHRMEDLLDRLYQEDDTIEADTLNLLYASTDVLQDLTSGEPDPAVLHETLDSLNAIYAEKLGSMPDEADTAPRIQEEAQEVSAGISDPAAAPSQKSKAHRRTAIPSPVKPADIVRVPLVKLDDLVKLVSELIINRSAFEQRMNDFVREVDELKLSSERLNRVSINMESKYEASALGGRLVAFGTSAKVDSTNPFDNSNSYDFDDLEFDRYTEFHLLSRELVETASDIRTLGTEMSTLISDFNSILNRQGYLSSEIQDKLIRTRMVPLARLSTRFQRVVRVLAQQQGKLVDFEIEGEHVELDKSVLDEMADPLLHLLRNAVDHGIEFPGLREEAGKPERGSITLRAFYEGNQVVIQVSDDGAGMEPEILRSAAVDGGFISEAQAEKLTVQELNSLVFLPGFSTAGEISEVSGRGVGLDIVKTSVQRLKGSVSLVSDPGQGTTFTTRLPLTMAVMQALLVKANNETFAIPRSVVGKILRMPRVEIDHNGQDPTVWIEEAEYPVMHLGQVLELKQPRDESKPHVPVLILNLAEKQVALVVDHILGGREIVVKSLGGHARRIHGVAGATLMGDGQVVIILNPSDLVLGASLPDASIAVPDQVISLADRDTLTVMIVDDSLSVRRVVSNLIKSAGWQPLAARDGIDALETVQRSKDPPDLILVDIEMPRMDGYELMSTLKANEAYQNIPLVVLTSRAGEKHRSKALAVGASEYIVKPYQDQTLINMIRQLVRAARGEPAL